MNKIEIEFPDPANPGKFITLEFDKMPTDDEAQLLYNTMKGATGAATSVRKTLRAPSPKTPVRGPVNASTAEAFNKQNRKYSAPKRLGSSSGTGLPTETDLAGSPRASWTPELSASGGVTGAAKPKFKPFKKLLTEDIGLSEQQAVEGKEKPSIGVPTPQQSKAAIPGPVFEEMVSRDNLKKMSPEQLSEAYWLSGQLSGGSVERVSRAQELGLPTDWRLAQEYVRDEIQRRVGEFTRKGASLGAGFMPSLPAMNEWVNLLGVPSALDYPTSLQRIGGQPGDQADWEKLLDYTNIFPTYTPIVDDAIAMAFKSAPGAIRKLKGPRKVGITAAPEVLTKTLDVPAASPAQTGKPIDDIWISPDDVEVHPDIQYKGGITNRKANVTDKYSGVDTFNVRQGGRIVTWRDTDGKLFVVDGHHRLDIAKRAKNFSVVGSDMTSKPAPRLINAEVLESSSGWTLEQARLYGVISNVMDEKGTGLDAAKAMRQIGYRDADHFAGSFGVSLKGKLARNVDGLLRLHDDAFESVKSGAVPEDLAAGLGSMDLTREQQMAAMRDATKLPGFKSFEQGRDLGQRIKLAEIEKTQGGFDFGSDFDEYVSTLVHEADIVGRVKSAIGRERAELARPLSITELEGEVIDKATREALVQGMGATKAEAVSKVDLAFMYDPELNSELRTLARQVRDEEITASAAAERIGRIVRDIVSNEDAGAIIARGSKGSGGTGAIETGPARGDDGSFGGPDPEPIDTETGALFSKSANLFNEGGFDEERIAFFVDQARLWNQQFGGDGLSAENHVVKAWGGTRAEAKEAVLRAGIPYDAPKGKRQEGLFGPGLDAELEGQGTLFSKRIPEKVQDADLADLLDASGADSLDAFKAFLDEKGVKATDDQVKVAFEGAFPPSVEGAPLAYAHQALRLTEEEFAKRTDQLRKVAKGIGINVFPDANSKAQFLGAYYQGMEKYRYGRIRMQSPENIGAAQFADTLAHELAHGIDGVLSLAAKNPLTGKPYARASANWTVLLGADRSEWKKVTSELKAVTEALVGKDVVDSDPQYFNSRVELWARFMQSVIFHPELIEEHAPNSFKMLTQMRKKHPVINDYLTIAEGGKIEHPEIALLPDRRQQYRVELGQYLGSRAYSEEVVYQAIRARAIQETREAMEAWLKDVPDTPEHLMKAAEGILTNEGGDITFGTRIYKSFDDDGDPNTLTEWAVAVQEGFKPSPGAKVAFTVEDESGRSYDVYEKYEKWRVTPSEARAAYETLSPEGKKVIDDYTKEAHEATSEFNRNLQKQLYGIDAEIEGYVHHFTIKETTGTPSKSGKLKMKKASSRMHRTESKSYEKDFGTSVAKGLTELKIEKAWNEFVHKQLPLVAEPYIPETSVIPNGHIVIMGDLKRGFWREGSRPVPTVKTSSGIEVPVKIPKYTIREDHWERFWEFRKAQEDVSAMDQAVKTIASYWAVNTLTHPATMVDNFAGGALQFAGKLTQDFYDELLKGELTLKSTRANLKAIFETLTPRGWKDAPDWVYGGGKNTMYGDITTFGENPGKLQKAADVLLGPMQNIERYWKKVILNAERNRAGLSLDQIGDREFLLAVNEVIDQWSFDYNNVHRGIDALRNTKAGTLAIPFLTFRYKLLKMYTGLAGTILRPGASWQDRLSAILTLSTIIGGIWTWQRNSERNRQTGEVPAGMPEGFNKENIDPQIRPGQRLFVGKDHKGNDVYLNAGKYAWFQAYVGARSVSKGELKDGGDLVADVFGGVGPLGDLALALSGYGSKYDQFKDMQTRMAELGVTFVPGKRILQSTADALDPSERDSVSSPQEVFGRLVPTTDPGTQRKLRGPKRTVNVPLPNGKNRYYEATKTQEDRLLQALTGVNLRRIPPEWWNWSVRRESQNARERPRLKLKRDAKIESAGKFR